MAREVVTHSADETRALGRKLGQTLKSGDVFFLEGDLGAGKTTFVKGIAEALGVETMVRSPTFALMHRYRGEGGVPDLVHIDLYREQAPEGLEDLRQEDEDAEVITVVEWPRHLAAGHWPDARRVRFHHVDESTRRIELP